jgi:hypothetical protein
VSLPPVPGQMISRNGILTPPWLSWFSQLYAFLTQTVSGATAARPTTNLYVGRYYYDTTLSIPVWVASLNPTVWVNSSGTPA